VAIQEKYKSRIFVIALLLIIILPASYTLIKEKLMAPAAKPAIDSTATPKK